MKHSIPHTNKSYYDDIYQNLVEVYEGKTVEDCFKINAKLILALINKIDNPLTIFDIINQLDS